jgi:hypothetical protein
MRTCQEQNSVIGKLAYMVSDVHPYPPRRRLQPAEALANRSIIEWLNARIRLRGRGVNIMPRLLAGATLTIFIALNASVLAQTTTVPGPGGVPLAPGSPVPGYNPGGIGPGGVEVAPGHAARNVPMYRIGPGGVPFPLRRDRYHGDDDEAARLPPHGPETLPRTLALTITSRDAGPGKPPSPDTPIDSIHDLFAVLRTCWEPPARDQAQECRCRCASASSEPATSLLRRS